MYTQPRTPSSTQPQTPPKTSKPLPDNRGPSLPAHFLDLEDESEDDMTTPKAHTSHVPLRPTQPSAVPEHLLLTHLPKTNVLQKSVMDMKELISGSPKATYPHRKDIKAAVGNLTSEDQSIPLGLKNSHNRSASSGYTSTSSSSLNSSRLENGTLVATFGPAGSVDLVLIPSNHNAEFHVESSVLSRASPILADLIDEIFQPQSGAQQAGGSDQATIHIHKINEKLDALDAVLRYCYPAKSKPKIRSIAHLDQLLTACLKYQILNGLHDLKVAIIQFASLSAAGKALGSPLDCYGIACRFGFTDIASLVSKYCLMVDISKVDLGYALVGVDTKDTKRFFQFHNWRVRAAIGILEAAVDAHELWCDGCSGLAEWYKIFVDKAPCALTIAPISTTIFTPSFTAACLKKCLDHCLYHYLSTKTQIRFAVLQKDIDALKDML